MPAKIGSGIVALRVLTRHEEIGWKWMEVPWTHGDYMLDSYINTGFCRFLCCHTYIYIHIGGMNPTGKGLSLALRGLNQYGTPK